MLDDETLAEWREDAEHDLREFGDEVVNYCGQEGRRILALLDAVERLKTERDREYRHCVALAKRVDVECRLRDEYKARAKRAEAERDEWKRRAAIDEQQASDRLAAWGQAERKYTDLVAAVREIADEWEQVEVPGRLVHDDVFREHAADLRALIGGES